MASSLQHPTTALFTGLQTASTGNLADRNVHRGMEKVESKERFPLFHTPDCGEITKSNAALH